MDTNDFMLIPNAKVPPEIAKVLKDGGNIHATEFEDKNDILLSEELQNEVGFKRMKNGDYLVSMVCPMPGLTAEMVNWWFWWHPQKNKRYKLWFPGEHYSVGYSKKNKAYFEAPEMPPFEPNIQYPTEKIGKIIMPLEIDFVSPEEFGFSKKLMEENKVANVVCGHVGAFRGLVRHTEMAHIFFKKDDGLFLVSRFWLGKTLKNPLIRKAILTSETAKGMALHCCTEYRNLANKLPLLFEQYAK